ncbi:hypothetical protein LX32DRAFT_253232 [Colletotrichum zoysiae]|uniref:Uncharacterized protein n=1 Tax=Colletotrichum zoysiae TaxID=1216348 RepID=A0AAD9HU61_9PEZI|nr:hypothetical protein LX32DRAFT_253232 [Colletotrichum zoysiae]
MVVSLVLSERSTVICSGIEGSAGDRTCLSVFLSVCLSVCLSVWSGSSCLFVLSASVIRVRRHCEVLGDGLWV